MATVSVPKSPTLLGSFCKGVKIFNFYGEIIFGQLLWTFGDFLLTGRCNIYKEIWNAVTVEVSFLRWKISVLIIRKLFGTSQKAIKRMLIFTAKCISLLQGWRRQLNSLSLWGFELFSENTKRSSSFVMLLILNSFGLSIWSVFCPNQCDQMARLFFNIWTFTSTYSCPIACKIC